MHLSPLDYVSQRSLVYNQRTLSDLLSFSHFSEKKLNSVTSPTVHGTVKI